MEVKPGYKLTEVGIIPKDWDVKTLKEISPRQSVGLVINPSTYFDKTGTVSMLVGSNIGENKIDWASAKKITEDSNQKLPASRLFAGDLVMVRVGEPGTTAVIPPEFDGCNCASMMIVRKHPSFDSEWLCFVMNSPLGRAQVAGVQYGTAQKQFNISDAVDFRYPVPSLPEQRSIAAVLSDVDALLAGLDQLIAKKRDLKQAAMQQLLTGKKRLPGFEGEWKVKRIADIAASVSDKNLMGDTLPVLTCSKHLGFVDSLGFFKNQVFSKDLSTYKIIRKGQIGYPANHVEEGSIGLQDLYDVALVSPIYVVFSVTEDINSFFLHRVLKLDSYRQKFKTATTSSVDRRGSLRWPAFSEITVALPTLPEQTAIATVLSDMETEIAALEQRRDKTHALKQGMMQELLTGRTRLL
jgi:type I restriction enzyme S subunit